MTDRVESDAPDGFQPSSFGASFDWIERFGTRLQFAAPHLTASAAARYAIAAVRGLGHESPEAAADRMAASLPRG